MENMKLKLFEEWMFNKNNKNLIEAINIVLENDDDDDMYELFKDILKKTHHAFTDDETEKLIEILKNGEFEMNPDIYADINSSKEIRNTLSSIARHLEKTNLKDIRIYPPNSGSGHFIVSDSDMSFHC